LIIGWVKVNNKWILVQRFTKSILPALESLIFVAPQDYWGYTISPATSTKYVDVFTAIQAVFS
jgi:hypothetical protein